ncbi:MAG TPA: hypothetical protein DEP05_03030 [Betaproteobacteria bacterium]|nr:hypothetical protein [Betaproteobacteria bacterium]
MGAGARFLWRAQVLSPEITALGQHALVERTFGKHGTLRRIPVDGARSGTLAHCGRGRGVSRNGNDGIPHNAAFSRRRRADCRWRKSIVFSRRQLKGGVARIPPGEAAQVDGLRG